MMVFQRLLVDSFPEVGSRWTALNPPLASVKGRPLPVARPSRISCWQRPVSNCRGRSSATDRSDQSSRAVARRVCHREPASGTGAVPAGHGLELTLATPGRHRRNEVTDVDRKRPRHRRYPGHADQRRGWPAGTPARMSRPRCQPLIQSKLRAWSRSSKPPPPGP